MSKTNLHRQLARLLRLAIHGEQQQITTSEVLERAAAARWSRRQFLQSAAASMAAVTLPRLPTFGGASLATTARVAIIGAGTAGLTAAYRLQQAGLTATLFEASKRAGGRMFSLRGKFADKQIAELGGELIDTGHAEILALCAELGLQVDDLKVEGTPTDLYYFGGKQISEAQLVEEFRPLGKRIVTALDEFDYDKILYNQTSGAEPYDKLSITEWLDEAEATPLIKSVLTVAYTGEFGLDPSEQSALNLITFIDPEPDGTLAIFGESDERYHLHEGSGALPEKLTQSLKAPPLYGTRLEAIRETSAGVFTVTVNDGKSRDEDFDIVILALPFSTLRAVDLKGVNLPDWKLKAIRELGYGTNAKLMTGYRSRVWDALKASGSTFSDLPYQGSWDTSRGQAGAAGLFTNFVGGAKGLELGQGTVDEQAQTFLKDIDQVFPGMAAQFDGNAARSVWATEPFALGSYQCYKPEQWTGIRGAEGEAVGKLFFAGEHTSLDTAGYMNGAVETGERVATEVLTALGIKA